MGTEARAEPTECGLYPLFYFHPEWGHPCYPFEHGLSIRKVGPEDAGKLLNALRWWCGTGEELKGLLDRIDYDEDGYWTCPIWDQSPLRLEDDELEWVLCVRLPPFAQERPPAEIGVDFRAELYDDMARAFLRSLRIVKDPPVFAPVRLIAPLEPSGPKYGEARLADPVGRFGRDDWENVPAPDFKEDDVRTIDTVWKRVADLLGLTDWRRKITQKGEDLFGRLDTIANLVRKEGELEAWLRSLEDLCGVSLTIEEARDILKRLEEKTGKDLRKPLSDQEAAKQYRSVFRRAFKELRVQGAEKAFCATRIGRTVQLLLDSLDLPPLHRVVAMCTVLETLVATEHIQEPSGEYLGRRLARLFNGDSKDAEAGSRQMEDIYAGRNDFVHGSRPADGLAKFDAATATSLATRAVLKVLCDQELFTLFSKGSDDDLSNDDLRRFFST